MSVIKPNFLSEQQCKEIATRQILPFLTLSDTKAELPPYLKRPSGEPLFSFDTLPDGAMGGDALFNWMSHDIYDVDGLLLFRDQSLDIGDGYNWCVRVSASDLLRVPVDCVRPDRHTNIEALKERVFAELVKHPGLEPLIVEGEEDVRLVCYNYPNLGILCYSQDEPATRFVMDLRDLTIIPVNPYVHQENPESVHAVWSPYDIVVRSTVALFRSIWRRNVDALPALPGSFKELLDTIAGAAAPKDVFTKPPLELIAQSDGDKCAAATAQMILKQHGEIGFTQADIAKAMDTVAGGATPENQVKGINKLVGTKLRATLEQSSPEMAQCEILADRPFKVGSSVHARAVAGFRPVAENKIWLHILNPIPTNQGSLCFEPWDPIIHANFMYVRPLGVERCSFR